MIEVVASVLFLLLTAATLAGVVLRGRYDRLEAEHAALQTEHEDLAIAHSMLTDRDERGRFVKKERADGQ